MRLYWKLLLEGQTLAMVLHHWLAAVSVAAMAALLLATGKAPFELSTSAATVEMGGAIRWPRRFCNCPSALVYSWRCPALQNPLLGDDWVSSLLFGVSLVMALGLMHHLSMIALGDIRHGAVVRTAGLMVATILLMAATLQHAPSPSRGRLPPREREQERTEAVP